MYKNVQFPETGPKVAVITGGTGGIGFEVARALAISKARVLLLSRKGEHGEEAIRKIKESADTGPIPDITFIECDLGNLGKVKKVGSQIREQEKRLDIVSSILRRYLVNADNVALSSKCKLGC